ncbi:MAG: dihydroxyacetone kinase subunit L [Chloroflexales bacterium]|nr:dihydroxyacetone kinase subunit L [Chloroflexales bacterium]
MQITSAQIVRFIEGAAATISEQRDYLTQLDSPIGDADHGANMHRGFSAVVASLPSVVDQDIGAILLMVSSTLIAKVGGSSGPLYGTAFLRASRLIGPRHTIEAADMLAALDAAYEGVASRGKSQRGQKTMLDTIGPAADALRAALDAGEPFPTVLDRFLGAAEQGMASTRDMLALRGRAAFLGERSIGHQDPGATSAFLLIRELVKAITEG